MKTLKMYCIAVISLGYISAMAQPPGTQLYYGLLHAHTLFSDGSGTPEEAYKKAKDAGLNFFAITEHNHDKAEQGAKKRTDGILIANNHDLYNSANPVTITRHTASGDETITVKSVKKAAQLATTANFLALYGQEFSTISSGNHMNVFNVQDVIEIPNGEFQQLFNWVKNSNDNNIILQMNHPDVHADLFGKNKDNDDYGIDEPNLGNGFAELINNTDKYVQLIEILSGPAMAETDNARFHYPDPHDDDYYFYLKQGFHLAPSVGQDNHYKTWGMSSDARIGVYATSLTKEALAEAFRSYRTFATEDKNLSVMFSVNGSPLGTNIIAGVDQPLNMEIKLTDTDDTSPIYDIEIYGGSVEPTTYDDAKELKAEDGLIDTMKLTRNGTIAYNKLLSSGDKQFYYIKIIERDGDRAWTAPIWINYPEAGVITNSQNDTIAGKFYWTKNTSSQIYHTEGCTSIESIKPENLMNGTTPPSGRHKHDCTTKDTFNH